MLASQRRLERKIKELNLTLDEERQTHTEQRDQVYTFTSYCMSIFEFTLDIWEYVNIKCIHSKIAL